MVYFRACSKTTVYERDGYKGLKPFMPPVYDGWFLTRYTCRDLPLYVIKDIVQETYVHAIEHANGFRGESKLETWIYQIARNLAIDTVDIFKYGHKIPFS